MTEVLRAGLESTRRIADGALQVMPGQLEEAED